MALGSKVLKPRWLPDLLLRSIILEGQERVLDVGCGRGLILTRAAKHLTTRRAVGVDIWRGQDQSGNSPQATLENARAEVVADRVEVITADVRRLPFEDGSFDAVLASLAIHNIPGKDERRRALLEIVRVLRPGGRVGILDFQRTRELAEALRESGMSDVVMSTPKVVTVPTVRIVAAWKP
jgi:ubiquinone/menaquinone biosynthesis C-methylase UbiE